MASKKKPAAKSAAKRAAKKAPSQNPDIDEDRNRDQELGDSKTDPAAEGNASKAQKSNDDVAKQGDQPDESPKGESKDDRKVKDEVGDAASRPDPAGTETNDTRSAGPDVSGAPKLDKALKEVRKVRDEAEYRLKFAGRTETDFSVNGIKDPDKDPNKSSDDQDGPELKIRTADGRVFVQIDDGPEAVFDQHGWAQVNRQSATAFQAVS